MTGACPWDDQPARLYPCGWRCDTHAPQPVNPTPDPALTLDGIRASYPARTGRPLPPERPLSQLQGRRTLPRPGVASVSPTTTEVP